MPPFGPEVRTDSRGPDVGTDSSNEYRYFKIKKNINKKSSS